MPTFEEGLQNPASKKLVYVRMNLRKHLYGWIEDALDDIWYTGMTDFLVSITEDENAMVKKTSLAALDSQDTSSVGAWFWDEAADRVYAKPLSSGDIFDFFYISTIRLMLSKHGGVLADDSLPYEGKISNVPSLALRTSEIFDGKVGQIGSGNVSMENADAFLVREDIEIDGELEVLAAFEA